MNDTEWERLVVPHETLAQGGTLRFTMSAEPVQRSYVDDQLPFSLS